MSDIAIKVQGLGKEYRVGKRERYKTMRETLMSFVTAPFRRNHTAEAEQGSEMFWALKDVSFEVNRGDVVGVIGRNGAGKSTLLKILSRITDPTEGRVEIEGRVGSLLEVGTGFHPELTGRENVYLNGAILGMHRGEIQRKFDEIVAFSEIEQFLDTPVKHYSSGMYMRLAFAVAAHLEPEILIVDEVLAVGDSAFQKKCLGKMGEVSKQGRTVLFVSHNMATVQSLCQKGILLSGGRIEKMGSAGEVVEDYQRFAMPSDIVPLNERKDRGGDGGARMTSLTVENQEPGRPICTGCRLRVRITYTSEAPISRPKFLVGIYDTRDIGVFVLDSEATGGLPDSLPAVGTVTCTTEPLYITPGRCFLNLAMFKAGSMVDYVQYAMILDIEPDDVYGTGRIPSREWMLCVVKHQWSLA